MRARISNAFESGSTLVERFRLITRHETIHGVDYLSVLDNRTVVVHFIRPEGNLFPDKRLPDFERDDFVFTVQTGGVEYRPETEVDIHHENYQLKLVIRDPAGVQAGSSLRVDFNCNVMDRMFSQASYTYDDTVSECRRPDGGPSAALTAVPGLDYLSKDFESFKTLIQDELTANFPSWREDNAADMMVMLTEILSYAGDYLSYEQDGAATEAYLETARFDVSLKRHCRLLDYKIANDVNSRTWVRLSVSGRLNVKRGSAFLCGGDGISSVALTGKEYSERAGGKEVVFESLHDHCCDQEFNELKLYDWGMNSFGIKAGACEVAVQGGKRLKKGQVVGFCSVSGSQQTEVVRLIRDAEVSVDPLTGQVITLLSWHQSDCLTGHWRSEDCIVYGNILLVDMGESIRLEPVALDKTGGTCSVALRYPNLVYAQKYHHGDSVSLPAGSALGQDQSSAVPCLVIYEAADARADGWAGALSSGATGEQWHVVSDFLGSTPYSREVVVEDNEGNSLIRFGNGVYGALPDDYKHYWASYRISPLQKRNVGAGIINQICLHDPDNNDSDKVFAVSNLVAALDGGGKESKDCTRKIAPFSHHNRLNLALPQDYIGRILSFPDVTDVFYEKQWSGSGTVLSFYIYAAVSMTSNRLNRISESLADSKMIDQRYTLCFFRPLLVHILMDITVSDRVHGNDVLGKLRIRFGDCDIAGVFYPPRQRFGRSLHQSELIRAALEVDGVISASLKSFQSLDDYVGSDRGMSVVKAIIPRGPEVISFAAEGRKSVVRFSINGEKYA